MEALQPASPMHHCSLHVECVTKPEASVEHGGRWHASVTVNGTPVSREVKWMAVSRCSDEMLLSPATPAPTICMHTAPMLWDP